MLYQLTAGGKGCEGKKKDQRNWPFGGVVATIVEPKNPKNQIFCWAFLKKTREIQINITRRFLKLHDLKISNQDFCLEIKFM